MNSISKAKRNLYRASGNSTFSPSTEMILKRKLKGTKKDVAAKATLPSYTVREFCKMFECELPSSFEAVADKPTTSIGSWYTRIEQGGVLLLLQVIPEDYEHNIKRATDKGVAAIFADREYLEKSGVNPSDYPIIVVDNGLDKFIDFYSLSRNAFKGKIIGITGSVGKSTTKELVSAVVKKQFQAYINPGNTNRILQVTDNVLYQLTDGREVYVQEAGAWTSRTVETIARLISPDISIVTNLKPHHISGYGSFENIIHDKMQLVECMKEGGTAVVNFDDENLAAYPYRCKIASVGITTDKPVKYRASNVVQDNDILRLDIESTEEKVHVDMHIIGTFNAYNALIAFATGKTLGMSTKKIVQALEGYRTSGIRQNCMTYGNSTLFVDCYNVCNETIVNAVNIIEDFHVEDGHRKIAIIGPENSLGEYRLEKTNELGKMLSEADIDEFVCYGTEDMSEEALDHFGDAPALYESLRDNNFPSVKLIQNPDSLCEYLDENVRAGDIVLFKGITYLNIASVIDRTYGTTFSISSKPKVTPKTVDGFTATRDKDADVFYIRDVSEKLLQSKKVVIPDEFEGYPVFGIDKGAFAYSDVCQVDMGNSICVIGFGAFRDCNGLTEVTIPDSVRHIKTAAFMNCSSLRKVHIGRNVKRIDRSVFAGCDKLKVVEIPKKEELQIEPEAFPDGVSFTYYD